MEDWTWKEEGKGRRMWRGYGMIRLEGQWWFWDEEEEVLRDGKGRVWGESQGKNNSGGDVGMK